MAVVGDHSHMHCHTALWFCVRKRIIKSQFNESNSLIENIRLHSNSFDSSARCCRCGVDSQNCCNVRWLFDYWQAPLCYCEASVTGVCESTLKIGIQCFRQPEKNETTPRAGAVWEKIAQWTREHLAEMTVRRKPFTEAHVITFRLMMRTKPTTITFLSSVIPNRYSPWKRTIAWR